MWGGVGLTRRIEFVYFLFMVFLCMSSSACLRFIY